MCILAVDGVQIWSMLKHPTFHPALQSKAHELFSLCMYPRPLGYYALSVLHTRRICWIREIKSAIIKWQTSYSDSHNTMGQERTGLYVTIEIMSIMQ